MNTNMKRNIQPENLADSPESGKRIRTSSKMEAGDADEGTPIVENSKWQLSKVDVKERLEYLRTSASFSDCVLLVGSGDAVETIRTHKMVLCMSSVKFEEILLTRSAEDAITITDVEPRIFHLMLDYMYLDKPIIKSSEDACLLYKAAVTYQMPHLCEISAKVLSKSLNLDNIWSILKLVSDTQESSLKEECEKFIRKHPLAILRHDNFIKVDANIVLLMVDLDCFDVPEIDIYTAVDKWAEHQCEKVNIAADRNNKREVIGSDILRKLRFLALNKEQFVEKVAYTTENSTTCLLSIEESYAVLMNMTVPGCYPMPTGFTVDNKPRKLSKLRCIRKVQPISAQPPYASYNTPPYTSPTTFPHMAVVAMPTASPSGNLGGKNFSLEIRVDFPIMLFGIQVPTLLFPSQQGPLGPRDYDESFIVTVLDSSGSPISHTVYSGKVPYGSAFDISLKDPVLLQKNAGYKIQIYTSNTYFLCRKLSNIEHCPPVKFTFKDSTKVAPPNTNPMFVTSNMKQDSDFGFVTQIIYSLWG
ncbi:BTB/POZ domain-containing protein 1-like isoform X1 [Schistocerca nitens]|uniref:BTB/POZ domain-containing protein 1-like isoform X1 n=1 Tax=Schistocerca nitens TaxID=7011 RepID=UPI002117920E|nr:BTB/POZ domain-containing protein 1-like isoform X1 [Schistocerca nitens]